MEKNPHPITIKHVTDSEKLEVINNEFAEGFAYIHKYNRSVTFFGSARSHSDDIFYKKAEHLAGRVAKELTDYVVVTGGGPGIMEAANKGAYEAGGKSVGFTIKLPHEQKDNKYLTGKVDFDFFFSRKTIMSFAAEAYIFFPGGFGTFDELFEVLTLVQTGKIERVPIVLVGKEYWQPLDDLIKKEMLEHHKTIEEEDMHLYVITDDEDEIFEIIKNAPIRN
jgi:uncharacterized protein (TIGR00730 family)